MSINALGEALAKQKRKKLLPVEDQGKLHREKEILISHHNYDRTKALIGFLSLLTFL